MPRCGYCGTSYGGHKRQPARPWAQLDRTFAEVLTGRTDRGQATGAPRPPAQEQDTGEQQPQCAAPAAAAATAKQEHSANISRIGSTIQVLSQNWGADHPETLRWQAKLAEAKAKYNDSKSLPEKIATAQQEKTHAERRLEAERAQLKQKETAVKAAQLQLANAEAALQQAHERVQKQQEAVHKVTATLQALSQPPAAAAHDDHAAPATGAAEPQSPEEATAQQVIDILARLDDPLHKEIVQRALRNGAPGKKAPNATPGVDQNGSHEVAPTQLDATQTITIVDSQEPEQVDRGPDPGSSAVMLPSVRNRPEADPDGGPGCVSTADGTPGGRRHRLSKKARSDGFDTILP